MDQTLKEIYLPYKKKLDKLAEKLAVMLSITEEEAETLIEDQIATEQNRWLREEEQSKQFNEMMEGSITVEAEIENMNNTYKTQCKNLTKTNSVEAA